jgi:hypothetical protein
MIRCVSSTLALSLIIYGCAGKQEPVSQQMGPAGTYRLDVEAMQQFIVDCVLKQKSDVLLSLPSEVRESQIQQFQQDARREVETLQFDLVLNEQGTFRIEGRLGDEQIISSGTWELDGEQLTLTVTHEDSESLMFPRVVMATIRDRTIRVAVTEEVSLPLVLSEN